MKGHDLEIVHDVALFILYDMALRANEYISPKKISQNTSNKIPESFLEKVLWELYEEKLVSNVLIMDQGAQYKINHSGIIHVQDRLTDKTSTISNYKKMRWSG